MIQCANREVHLFMKAKSLLSFFICGMLVFSLNVENASAKLRDGHELKMDDGFGGQMRGFDGKGKLKGPGGATVATKGDDFGDDVGGDIISEIDDEDEAWPKITTRSHEGGYTVTEIENEDGTSIRIDDYGDWTQETRFDAEGRVTGETAFDENGEEKFNVVRTYGEDGTPTMTVRTNRDGTKTQTIRGEDGSREVTAYDADGELTRSTTYRDNPDGTTSVHQWTPEGGGGAWNHSSRR